MVMKPQQVVSQERWQTMTAAQLQYIPEPYRVYPHWQYTLLCGPTSYAG